MCGFKQWAPRMEPHDPVNKESQMLLPTNGSPQNTSSWRLRTDSIDSISSGWSPAITTGKASQPQNQAQESRFSQLI